ncbi:hypothetical protein FIBSPDRAFT_717654, partial [Athelia psychrophila]
KGKSQKKKVPSKAVWKSADDAVLIKALVKEREARHQSDSGFKPLSWVACAAALKGIETKSGGVAKSKSSCQEHYKKIKKEYSIVKAIREQLGFGWDDTLKIATAPEDVWETYIASHQKAVPFKPKGFPFFDHLQLLVHGIIANG